MQPENGRWIQAVLARRDTLPEVMKSLLRARQAGYSGRREDEPDWAALLALPYAEEYERLTTWLDELLVVKPIPDDINGLYIGIMYPAAQYPSRKVAIFVVGSRRYGEAKEWVQDNDYSYDEAITVPEVLSAIYRHCMDVQPGGFPEWDWAIETCWQWASMVVAEWLSGPMRRKLLGTAPRRHIFCGLDPWMGFSFADLTPENTP